MFKAIDCEGAKQLIHDDPSLIVADVRDQASYLAGHVPGAVHLSVERLRQFCENTDKSTPILVYCYHGVSSQSVANHLIAHGFSLVYSLTGGFEVWRSHFPVDATDHS